MMVVTAVVMAAMVAIPNIRVFQVMSPHMVVMVARMVVVGARALDMLTIHLTLLTMALVVVVPGLAIKV